MKSYDAVSGDRTLVLTEVDISEKEEAKKEAERLANQDFLTGLRNRHYLKTHANDFIENALKEGDGVFLLLLDLDRFKAVNDALGHSVGDALLVETARKLRREFEDEAIVGRLGGDEFCVLFRSRVATTDVSRMCRTVLNRLNLPVPIQQHTLRIESSAGLCHVRSLAEHNGFDDLLMKADLALYSAKKSGGGTIRLFRRKLQQQRQRFFQVEEELGYALTDLDEMLSQKYQPIVCVNTGRIFALEALTRLT